MTDTLTGNFDKREALKVTIPMEEFDKLEKLALSAHTDKLSVEKLQEQLYTAKKALTEIQQLKRRNATNLGMINKLQTIAKDALAAIGGDK